MTQNSTERHRIAQKVKKMFKNGLKEAQNGTEVRTAQNEFKMLN